LSLRYRLCLNEQEQKLQEEEEEEEALLFQSYKEQLQALLQKAHHVLGKAEELLKAKKKEQSLDELVYFMKQVESLEIPSDTKTQILETYEQAKQYLAESERLLQEARRLEETRKDIPKKLEQAKKELEQAHQQPFTSQEIDPKLPLDSLEKRRLEAQSTKNKLFNKLKEIEKQIQEREQHENKTLQERTTLELDLKALQKKAETPLHSEQKKALEKLFFIKEKYLQSKNFYEEQLKLYYEMERDLLPLQKDTLQLQLSSFEKVILLLEQQVSEKKREVAKEQTKEIRQVIQNLFGKYPSHSKILETHQENEDFLKQRTGSEGLINLIARVSAEMQQVLQEMESIQENFQELRDYIEKVGLTNRMGHLLRQQKENFLDFRRYRKNLRLRQEELARVQEAILTLPKKRNPLLNTLYLQQEIQALLKNMPQEVQENPEAQKLLHSLFTQKSEILRELIQDFKSYRQKLKELNTEESKLIEEAQKFETFINEHIFWIQSHSPLKWQDLHSLLEAFFWLLNPHSWLSYFSALFEQPLSSFWGFYFLLFFSFFLYLSQKTFRRFFQIGIQKSEQALLRPSHFSFPWIFCTLLLPFILPLPAPLLFWNIGFFTRKLSGVTLFQEALGSTLMQLSFSLYIFLWMYECCAPRGFLEDYLQWKHQTVAQIRKELSWFCWFFLVTFGIVFFLEHSQKESFQSSLGRLAFLIHCFSLTFFLHRILFSSREILLKNLSTSSKQNSFLRYFALPFFIATPLLFALMSCFGYVYTALQLQQRYHHTLILCLLIFLLHLLLGRWSALARLRLVLNRSSSKENTPPPTNTPQKPVSSIAPKPPQQPVSSKPPQQPVQENSQSLSSLSSLSKKKQKKQKKQGTVPPPPPKLMQKSEQLPVLPPQKSATLPPLEEPLVFSGPPESASVAKAIPSERNDLKKLKFQTQQVIVLFLFLIFVGGAWSIWSDIFPAFGILKSIELHPIPMIGIFLGALTLADIFVVLAILFLTWMVTRNITGVLEIFVLQRFSLDAGTRYAITSLAQYLSFLLGAGFMLHFLGVTWSKIQWLFAAFSVGLGFGLQEIFANFVSGLILLFEQPIRIGDTVTVGDTSGSVSKIRIRATTILTWDRKELIVPNKQFITENVLNWSLSSRMIRLIIPIGVVYGSSIPQVQEKLLEISKKHPKVLKDPAPQAFFMQFGECNLDFELRVFLADHDDFLVVRHELCNAIEQVFRESHIDMAFPQRDIYIKNLSQPLHLVLEKPPLNATTPKEDKS
jgi:potassium efflux system protein